MNDTLSPVIGLVLLLISYIGLAVSLVKLSRERADNKVKMRHLEKTVRELKGEVQSYTDRLSQLRSSPGLGSTPASNRLLSEADPALLRRVADEQQAYKETVDRYKAIYPNGARFQDTPPWNSASGGFQHEPPQRFQPSATRSTASDTHLYDQSVVQAVMLASLADSTEKIESVLARESSPSITEARPCPIPDAGSGYSGISSSICEPPSSTAPSPCGASDSGSYGSSGGSDW